MNPGVLLTDAQERAAPAAVESLSRAGYRVGAASNRKPAPGQWSRYCGSRYTLPDPRFDTAAFAARVAEITDVEGFAALLPGSDAALMAISDHRELFSDAVRLGLPPREAVDECVSKIALLQTAASAGIPAPETVICQDRGEAHAAAERLGYPVTVKPHRTVLALPSGNRQHTALIVSEEKALDARLLTLGFPALLQRREHGTLFSIGGAMADGELLAIVVSKYLRTWPPNVGSVSFSETIEPPGDLVDSVRTLVASMGWQGIFELECIATADGRFAAIDFNPRLYGSLALALSAGVQIPAIWCDWLLKDRRKPTCTEARAGLRYRWTDSDLRHIWTYARQARFADAASVLRPWRHTTHPYFRCRDPAPGLARLLQMLRVGLLNRIRRFVLRSAKHRARPSGR